MDDEQWMTAEEAAAVLRVSLRQAHRYTEGDEPRIRIRKAGRRHMFNKADVDALASDLGVEYKPAPKTELLPPSDLLDYLRETQNNLNQALQQVGFLQGQLSQRPTLEDQQGLHTRIAELEAERDALRAELEKQRRRRWWWPFRRT